MAMSPLAQALALQQTAKIPQEQIQPANVLGAYQLATDAAYKTYAAKLAAQNALWGGLASLGGAGILGFGKPAFENWLKSGGTAAADVPGASGLTGDLSFLKGATPVSEADWNTLGIPGGAYGYAPDAAVTGGTGWSDAVLPALPAGQAATYFPGAGMSGVSGWGVGGIPLADATPTVAADLGVTGTAAPAGTVAADIAGTAAPAAAGTSLADLFGLGAAGGTAAAAAPEAGGATFSLADLLPFLFAA